MIIRARYAEARGVRLEVIKHPEAKRGFVLSPVGGRAQLCRGGGFRSLAEDYERLSETVAALRFVVFTYLFLHRAHNILLCGCDWLTSAANGNCCRQQRTRAYRARR
jgi:hypothetical protein